MSGPEPALSQAIRDARRVLVPLHLSPDGDSVGSALAAAWAVEALGASAYVTTADPIPRKYHFLSEGDRAILDPGEVEVDFDLLLLVDGSSTDRVGRSADLIDAHTRIYAIDHHRNADSRADWLWSDPGAAATAQMLMRWFDELSLVPTPFIASCLYTGLATDTGFFAYANTTSCALYVAGRMVECGASPDWIHARVNEHRTEGELRLLGVALTAMRVDEDGRVTWVILDDEAFRRAGASQEETEGIINHLRALDGVEVAMVITCIGAGPARVSFRSRGRIDVGALAAEFGGGGHDRASGCTLDMPAERARTILLARIRSLLGDRA